MMVSRSSILLAFLVPVFVACGDDGTGAEAEDIDIAAGNWVSVETYTGTNGTTGNLRVSIDPVTDPTVLTGSWSLGTLTGTITDEGLAGSDISLIMSGHGTVSLTGTVSSDAIVGNLNGAFLVLVALVVVERWSFNGTSVTLRRGSY